MVPASSVHNQSHCSTAKAAGKDPLTACAACLALKQKITL